MENLDEDWFEHAVVNSLVFKNAAMVDVNDSYHISCQNLNRR